jgi:hypothetical protein
VGDFLTRTHEAATRLSFFTASSQASKAAD